MPEIEVRIDEKACVGCTMCVDICPTRVFESNDDESVPRVSSPGECFGCLSCSELCPATAIKHTGLLLSENYHHDRYALQLAAKMGRPPRDLNVPDDESQVNQALQDLGVRLLSVASVLKQTLGQSLPSVGTKAGMSLAAQFPRYQPITTLLEACTYLEQALAPAWDLSLAVADDQLTITVKQCYVRSLCQSEGLELGGDICTLFYNYLAGYFSKLGKKRPRLVASTPGDSQCTYSVKLYG
jgi:NAD-dependent dihydropyrimidine dehydrogenase PreA subunit